MEKVYDNYAAARNCCGPGQRVFRFLDQCRKRLYVVAGTIESALALVCKTVVVTAWEKV